MKICVTTTKVKKENIARTRKLPDHNPFPFLEVNTILTFTVVISVFIFTVYHPFLHP